MRKIYFVTVCALAFLTTACTGDSNRPVATGEGTIRAINTISSAPDFSFLIEERTAGGAAYANASQPLEFDDLEYTFNFQVALPGLVGPQRVASVQQKIEKDHSYSFLITGEVAAPDIIVWDYPITEVVAGTTTFEVRFGHTAESVGPIDVYFAPAGVAPAAGAEVASLAFGELSAPITRESGEFVYIITSAGNPGDILFESNATTGTAQTNIIISPFDGTDNNPGPLVVRTISQSGFIGSLADVNVPSTVRFFHASIALETSDVYSDDMLTEQVLANHAYQDVTGDIELSAGDYTFTYTPAGNSGSVLLEATAVVFPASRLNVYVVGQVDALAPIVVNPDRRSVETLTKLEFVHAAFNHPAIDLYITEAGTPLDDANPRFFGIPPGTPPLSLNIDQGDLEMHITIAGEKTIIAGPVAFTAELGDLFQFIAYDNVDPATADLVAIPLP